MPGDVVRVKLTEEKNKYTRGELLEVLEPSPKRVAPQCKHFTDCGGCCYQHIDAMEQTLIKSAILKEQLERIGGIMDIPEIENVKRNI
jgi:23S rRNA (uracil1939-C5)-methyltransferase